VIAALWPTDDEASQFIMQRFYHYLTANPSLGRSAALCQAQRDCLKETAFVAPAYWAPFFLTGSTYPLAFEFSSIPQTES
jgi:CHAT domain-containing protein